MLYGDNNDDCQWRRYRYLCYVLMVLTMRESYPRQMSDGLSEKSLDFRAIDANRTNQSLDLVSSVIR